MDNTYKSIAYSYLWSGYCRFWFCKYGSSHAQAPCRDVLRSKPGVLRQTKNIFQSICFESADSRVCHLFNTISSKTTNRLRRARELVWQLDTFSERIRHLRMLFLDGTACHLQNIQRVTILMLASGVGIISYIDTIDYRPLRKNNSIANSREKHVRTCPYQSKCAHSNVAHRFR